MQRVSSRNNPRVKEAARLIASSRDRRKAGKCVLEGEHLIAVYLDRVGAPESLLVVDDDARRAARSPRWRRACRAHDVLAIPAALFAEVSTLPVAIGAVAVVPTPAPSLPPPARFHLLLDDLQDPGNVGTMLRTAAAAGVEQVLLSKHCAFAWSPKALRAGQGAHFLTTIVEDVDLPAWAARVPRARRARGRGGRARRRAISTTRRWPGRSPSRSATRARACPRRSLARADVRVTIPMPGGMESLNAAAAAAVVLFEAVRQRRAAANVS